MSVNNIKNINFNKKDNQSVGPITELYPDKKITARPTLNPLLVRRKSTKMLQLKEHSFIEDENDEDIDKVDIVGSVTYDPFIESLVSKCSEKPCETIEEVEHVMPVYPSEAPSKAPKRPPTPVPSIEQQVEAVKETPKPTIERLASVHVNLQRGKGK